MQPVRIVIASPGDLQPERDLLAETVIPSLNKTIARSRNLVLQDFRWETDTTPGFHPLGWQGKIDHQLRITEAHFLVVMFWKRFGHPIQSAGETGTEHELRIAFEEWFKTRKYPEIFVYFKEEPFFTSSVDDVEQFLRVCRFRSQFRKGGPYELGSYHTFKTTQEFERAIHQHLSTKILELTL